jgi:hypothetical protein
MGDFLNSSKTQDEMAGQRQDDVKDNYIVASFKNWKLCV